ncbi:MAG: signal peptidase I [Planctomycetes bacterium]|nr:signal peptidase I [Planctomycetota bacterium]
MNEHTPASEKPESPGGFASTFAQYRRLAAGPMFLFFEIAPVWGLVIALRAGSGIGLGAALGFMVLFALPSLGILRGHTWAYVLGQYLSATGFAAAVILGLTKGFSVTYYFAAGTYASLLILLTLSSPARAVRQAHQKEDDFGLWLKENLEAVVVAFIMALVIRCFFIEVFKIPSSSMEPTLMGDNAHRSPSQGDRIMVTKYYFALNPVERFDVVVFKFPLNQVRNFIKRVVGLPEEELFVERGNLFTRPSGDPNAPFRLARKPLRTQQSVWIHDVATGFEADKKSLQETWRVDESTAEAYDFEDGKLTTFQHRDSKDIRFIHQHDVADNQRQPVGEVSFAFTLELRDKTGFFFVDFPTEFGRFKLVLSCEQANHIQWLSKTKQETVPLKTARLEPERRYRVEFLVYDGAALAIIDGQTEAETTFAEFYTDLKPPLDPDHLAFGSQNALFSLSELEIGRDIYYKPSKTDGSLGGPSRAIRIPPDNFLMMGDNVNSSHDSREWKEEVYYLTNDAARRLGIDVTPEMLADYGGPVIRCQDLELRESTYEARKRWADRRGLPVPPYHIPADHLGYERGLYEEDLAKPHEPRPFPFVHRKYLVGKALWVWWPPGRWFRLIR